MQERELVKIKSDNPAYPQGYYTQFKDKMKPGDVEFKKDKVTKKEDESEKVATPKKHKK